MCAWAPGCFYSHISTRTFRRALTASLDSCAGDKECRFNGVTKSGRVWRRVPESDVRQGVCVWPWYAEWNLVVLRQCQAFSALDYTFFSGSLPGESYRRRLRSFFLYLCYVFRALINSLVSLFFFFFLFLLRMYRSAHETGSLCRPAHCSVHSIQCHGPTNL